ncbi:MAG: hypothetical protein Q7J16_01615 [Candidatus Cloacimonadales bacterium]|nr:hypothetical protein [Candidatus Cloacimonadales bacterium]
MAKRTKGKIQSKFYAKTLQEWQTWLEDNQDNPNEIWLMFYRPHTERQNVGYEESLEAATRFGWKQTLIKRIDDDSYARKFVPLTPSQKKKKEEQKKPDKEAVEPEMKREEKRETVILPSGNADDLETKIFDEADEKNKENFAEKSDDDFLIDKDKSQSEEPSKKEKKQPATVVEITEEKETEAEEPDEYLTFESEFGKADIDSEESEDRFEDVEWKTVREISEPEETEDDLTFEETDEEPDSESKK